MDCVIGPAQRTDADALPLLIYSSPGPSLIRNNELFATGQCMFFGGAGVMPREERVAPQDVVFQRNWLRKLERWNVRSPKWDQVNWVIKPGIESKNSLRVLVEGNLIENSFNWPAVHITSRYTLDWTIQHNAAVNCITMLNLWDTSNIENGPGLKRFQFYGTDATLQASVVTPGDFDVAQNAMLETFTSHKGPAYTQGN